MRTKEQIKNWLKEQPWYADYIFNCVRRAINLNDTIKQLEERLDGKLGIDTINKAFLWAETPQGHSFWMKINDEFKMWYNNTTTFENIECLEKFSYNCTTYIKVSTNEACKYDDLEMVRLSDMVNAYKANKTKGEIAEYLKKQKWFTQYITNIILDDNSLKNVESFINGEAGKGSIGTAFDWAITREGKAFWEAADREFDDWYSKETFLNIPINGKFYVEKGLYRKISSLFAVPENKIVVLKNDTVIEKEA